MSKEEITRYCFSILMRTQNRKLQKLFYENPWNADIVIDRLKKDDIGLFTQKMLKRLEKYIKEE